MKISYLIIFSIIISLLTSCKGSGDRSPGESIGNDTPIKYYSKNNPGKWKDLPGDHTPTYKITQDKENKIITVTVPFKGTVNPIHYVEVIVLLDHNRKELQKKNFQRGTQTATAVFKLPKDYLSFVYVVAKCNLHDMWEVKITW